MLRAVCVFLLFSALAYAQTAPSTVRIGVAVMKNTSTRSVAARLQRDRLVQYLNHSNPKHPKAGQTKIDAVVLEGDSPESIGTQARDKNCDYVVFTELTELRAPGDPQLAPRPGTIRIGSDPLANDPPLPTSNAPVHYAVIEFTLTHNGQPVLTRSVSGKEPMEADTTVSQLMGQIADRVRAEVTNPTPREIQ